VPSSSDRDQKLNPRPGWPTSIIHCDIQIHYYVYTYYCTLEGITISVIKYPRIDDFAWLSENWWRRLNGCRRNFFHIHPELSRRFCFVCRSLSTIHRKKTLACQKVLCVKLWYMLFGMFCCDVSFCDVKSVDKLLTKRSQENRNWPGAIRVHFQVAVIMVPSVNVHKRHALMDPFDKEILRFSVWGRGANRKSECSPSSN